MANVESKTALVTPEMCRDWLSRNPANRKLDRRIIDQYARDMASGDWELNGETICIDWNNNLINGQHRCTAGLKAGVPFETVLVTGLPPKARDTIDGGTGQDMISFLEYQSSATNVIADIFSSNGLPPTGAQASGIYLDLNTPANSTGLAAGLTLTSVERVTGSGRQDVFFGDSGENDFRGLGDYDWFVSSTGGRERYFGGDGLDTVTYYNASAGVTANLSNGAVVNGRETGYGSRGDAARDLYFEIENLVGSHFDDELRGSSERNQLNGLEGDDLIFGYGNVDYMMGGLGNDTIDGGAGSDYALFSGNAADYTLTRGTGSASNQVTVVGADGTDLLIDVEYFRFDDTDLNIWGL